MDPTTNLKEQRERANAIIAAIDSDADPDPHDVERLAELSIAFVNWIAGGGFHPTAEHLR